MTCPRCQRYLIGSTLWCTIHGDQVDYGLQPVTNNIPGGTRGNQNAKRREYDREQTLPGFEVRE